jgi:hypothetical protein
LWGAAFQIHRWETVAPQASRISGNCASRTSCAFSGCVTTPLPLASLLDCNCHFGHASSAVSGLCQFGTVSKVVSGGSCQLGWINSAVSDRLGHRTSTGGKWSGDCFVIDYDDIERANTYEMSRSSPSYPGDYGDKRPRSRCKIIFHLWKGL